MRKGSVENSNIFIKSFIIITWLILIRYRISGLVNFQKLGYVCKNINFE